MESIFDYFAGLSNGFKLLWIFFWLFLFWIIESFNPLFEEQYARWKHARTNLFLLFTTIIINALFGLATAGVFIFIEKNNFGLLNWVALPAILELIIGIMILDFIAQYIVHYLLHKVKFMWRFHMVHHSDTHVDVTTGTRHHPIDYVMRECFSLIAIVIGGLPLAYYIIYRLLTVFFTYFSHSNIKMNDKLDRVLSYVFITPNLHKVHHHYERPWTDTNYGNIFSIWDRIFGTLVYVDTKFLNYGLDVTDASKSDKLKYQLTLPFDKSIKTDY